MSDCNHNLCERVIMLTIAYPVDIEEHSFPIRVEANISPQSESILILDFYKLDGTKMYTAVLLPSGIEIPFCLEDHMASYPIFSPRATVGIKFGYHVCTNTNQYTFWAAITTRSQAGMPASRLHGL